MPHERLKNSFGKISLIYDEVRPNYPGKLIHDVIEISDIPNGGKVLEIGTGTGKATISFAEKGYAVTALDISKEQMDIARKKLSKLSNIRYIVSAFERAVLPANYFDLIFAAQTFHWIDPKTGYKKASKLLKSKGYLAFFSNFPAKTKLEQQIRKLYTKYCPDTPSGDYGTLRKLQEQFEGSGLFGNIERRTYMRNIEYTRKKYLGLVSSFSWVSTLSRNRKSIFFKELEHLLGEKRKLSIPIESILLVAKKR